MLLIGKVLLLQVAIVLGKIIYGAKDLLFKQHPQVQYPVYIPQPYYPHSSHNHQISGHDLHSSLFGSKFTSRDDDFAAASSWQPQYRSPDSIRPNPNVQLQMNFGQPQGGAFNGIPLQAPQQVRTSNFNQERVQFATPLNNQFFNQNEVREDIPVAQPFVQEPLNTKPSMTPQELQKMLSDAIAQVSLKGNQRVIRKRSLKSSSGS